VVPPDDKLDTNNGGNYHSQVEHGLDNMYDRGIVVKAGLPVVVGQYAFNTEISREPVLTSLLPFATSFSRSSSFALHFLNIY
jgi:hypothetical protein